MTIEQFIKKANNIKSFVADYIIFGKRCHDEPLLEINAKELERSANVEDLIKFYKANMDELKTEYCQIMDIEGGKKDFDDFFNFVLSEYSDTIELFEEQDNVMFILTYL